MEIKLSLWASMDSIYKMFNAASAESEPQQMTGILCIIIGEALGPSLLAYLLQCVYNSRDRCPIFLSATNLK